MLQNWLQKYTNFSLSKGKLAQNKYQKELRYEIKIAIDHVNLPLVESYINSNSGIFLEDFPERLVNNIYFDSLDLDCFKQNILGNNSRHKVRLRWYGELNNVSNPQLEFKIKEGTFNKKEIYKIINPVSLSSNWSHIYSAISDELKPKPLITFLKHNQPVLINQYKRKYLRSQRENIRITIDYQLIFFGQLASHAPNFSLPVKLGNYVIIELKAPMNASNLLNEILNQIPFAVTKSSKYVIGTSKTMNANDC